MKSQSVRIGGKNVVGNILQKFLCEKLGSSVRVRPLSPLR